MANFQVQYVCKYYIGVNVEAEDNERAKKIADKVVAKVIRELRADSKREFLSLKEYEKWAIKKALLGPKKTSVDYIDGKEIFVGWTNVDAVEEIG